MPPFFKRKVDKMISDVIHIGITVSSIESSIRFYRDVLGLSLVGRATMRGKETDLLFGREGITANLAYLKGEGSLASPPIELIEFIPGESGKERKQDLFSPSISEVCFRTDDIEKEYLRLKEKGVEFLSSPQFFDFRSYGMGKSKAVYFKDIDGTILELIEIV